MKEWITKALSRSDDVSSARIMAIAGFICSVLFAITDIIIVKDISYIWNSFLWYSAGVKIGNKIGEKLGNN